MYVVIMAGGKGTRISSVASDIPKPMIKVGGKPVLQHQIENFSEQGFKKFILVVGHLKHVITDYFKDGQWLGVDIDYFEEEIPLGTAGALPYLKEKLYNQDFFLVNGDIMIDMNFSRFYHFHQEKNAMASIVVHPNCHPYDSALVVSNFENKVVKWINKEEERLYYKNAVNAGVHILNGKVLDLFPTNQVKVDLDRDIFSKVLVQDSLFAYYSPEYIKDMGTPERYTSVCNDYETGFVKKRNLINKQKAIFLDRDGTINKFAGFITSPSQLELLENAAEAIAKINTCGYLAIVITNQPVIARGECTVEELNEINNKLETLLGEKGAYIDALYYCPHHPDKGFEGERVEYKIKCDCRKPAPGLIYQAQKDFNIDLAESWMVGDDKRDIEAGINAGCKTVLIGQADVLDGYGEACCFESLFAFTETLRKITED